MMASDSTRGFSPWRAITWSAFITVAIAIGLMTLSHPIYYYLGGGPESLLEVGHNMVLTLIAMAFLSPVFWLGVALICLPIHFLLMKAGLTKQWHYFVSGQVVGVLGASLLRYNSALGLHETGLPLVSFYMLIGLSGVAASYFWRFSRQGDRVSAAI